LVAILIAMTDSEFSEHLAVVSDRWEQALAFSGYDAAIVTAGTSRNYFLDDQSPPHRVNPHFLQWCPSELTEGSALLISPGKRSTLYFLQPNDYWHQPPELPESAAHYQVEVHADAATLLSAVESAALASGNHIAYVGEAGPSEGEKFLPQDVNPSLLLNHLHFDRAVKTPFELSCMRQATAKAVAGHLAARDAFRQGKSEFHINLDYLAASEQLAAELPYSSIVALNEHAGVLHYQHYDRLPPAELHSFLIDAGGNHQGYAADITRTYARESEGQFASLIKLLDAAQRELIDDMVPGGAYLDLHVNMHRRLAGILELAGLVTCSADAAFEAGITESFLPHGLGHLIGLQTHDVGGQQSGSEGGVSPPPDNYAALRLTRDLEAGMPVTIEPGLYFIPQLLSAARTGANRKLINWPTVDALIPYGGIRIEDNVVLCLPGDHQGEDQAVVENLTRDAFALTAE
jgi:Xaa-Pro dipeptidase